MSYNQKRNNQDWKHNHENDFHQKKKMIKSKSTQLRKAKTKKWMVMSENTIRKTTWSQERGDQEWEHTMGRQSWIRT
jgi:hypothetical protein